ncbi:CYTH domain-containing protein [Lentisphaera profundi]|uniref:CYTH domain-containing protein n=1 Tax=Lentisphaera profundi TaxID=1658616 RepID=A0ABY7VZV2_9BACT|nr:CYTH domain-containing protein [Lentisphaera profundi]WDE98397.1 CYTH domain-containing protein [Lentisphaera profundi]
MALEIEKKFLVKGKPWLNAPSQDLRQGYISKEAKATVRVRIAQNQAWLTIKGKTPDNSFSRLECEYNIPLDDAETMLTQLACSDIISKTRYTIQHAGFEWTIDVFEGVNDGLILAEIELPSEDTLFERPDWAYQEVTFDHRFSNSSLSNFPWKQFSDEFKS